MKYVVKRGDEYLIYCSIWKRAEFGYSKHKKFANKYNEIGDAALHAAYSGGVVKRLSGATVPFKKG